MSLSISSVQSQVVDVNTVQVILKSQNLGIDKNFGVYRANITITTNKIGNLTYREAFYYTDYTSGQQTFYQTKSYDIVMKDYTVSFLVSRPGLKSERDRWNSIKATVILDKNVVFETWISQSGTYKSFAAGKERFTNESIIQIGKTRPIVEKRPSIFMTPNININDTEGERGNSTDTKQSPIFEAPAVITIIFSVYVFVRCRNRR